MMRPPKVDLSADLDALSRVVANAAMLDYLRAHSGPRTSRTASPWDIDGFELHSHPDLSERLDELAAGVPGGNRFRGVYGYAALIDDRDVLRVVALGNAGLAMRIEDPGVRADIAANSRFSWESVEGWIGADPWPVDLPLEEGTTRVRSWLKAAFAEREIEPHRV